MFESYLLERENAVLIKHKYGFGIYKDTNTSAGYLQDIWVHPEHRKFGYGKEILAKAIHLAKQSNKKQLLASTDVTANNASQSMLAILNCKFEVLKTDGNVIWYIMEIANG